MFLKHLVCFLILTTLVCCKKSFVLVIDTTASMRDEITTIKNHIDGVVQNLRNSTEIAEYILVTFTDPVPPLGTVGTGLLSKWEGLGFTLAKCGLADFTCLREQNGKLSNVGLPLIFSKPEDLISSLSEIEVRGGHDCPENSLTALAKALEVSKNNSNIFLFTDAQAKDVHMLPSIETLCRQSDSQVVTFLSGECPGESSNLNVYNDIAKLCSGSVFHLDIQHLRLAFNYMKEIVNVEWSNINTHKEFMGSKQFNFELDSYTKDVVVAVSGDYPEIQITNDDGESQAVQKIMDTRRALVVRLLKPGLGRYSADICSRGSSLATFYKWKELKFLYGFSPRKVKSLKETSNFPLPDVTSFILIQLLDPLTKLYLLEQRIGDERITAELEILDEEKGLYVAELYFEHSKQYRISIHGRQKDTNEVIKGFTESIYYQITPTIERKATVEMIEPKDVLVEFMSNITMFCKVTGEPKPDIVWEDGNSNRIESEDFLLEVPSLYISYATIYNATTNSTFQCKCENSGGEDSLSMEMFVHRDFTFEVLQYPTDQTIEYGTDGSMQCAVNAYPEATIKWYHNGTEIEAIDNFEISSEDNTLHIKNMSLLNVGEYRCDVTNEVETKTFTANVDISGLEAPSVEVSQSEYILKPGDWMEVECNVVKGNPEPEVAWKKRTYDETEEIPEGVSVDGNSLKIPSATSQHGGKYVCEAANIVGIDAKEVEVKLQYPPKIKNGDVVTNVKVGDLVELECDVESDPKAFVTWNMYQDDVIIALDDHHRTDERHTHRFIAQSHDSGIYHCTAVNPMGRADRKVTVNVLVSPFIETPEFKTLTARTGGTVLLTCNILLGHPVPSTRWEYISPKSVITILSRKTTARLDLVLRNISRQNEGTYQCVADNTVGSDTVKVILKVSQ